MRRVEITETYKISAPIMGPAFMCLPSDQVQLPSYVYLIDALVCNDCVE